MTDESLGYRGLVNEGMTCYINSLLQAMYSLGSFRGLVYRLTYAQNGHQEGQQSILLSLQRIFFNLQNESDAVRTYELLKAFGFTEQQRMIQEDASEFQMYLNDYLEDHIKGTDEEALFKHLFFGEKENVIKCSHVNYESASKESYNNLSVHLQESNTLEEALRSLFRAEDLTGENQYLHETHGKQDAKKFMRIKSMPAVLQININRFGVSSRGEMIKINSRCEFDDYLDFDKIMEGTDSFELSQASDRISSQQALHSQKAITGSKDQAVAAFSRNTYRLHAILCHNGTLNSGHYFCYLRTNKSHGGSERI